MSGMFVVPRVTEAVIDQYMANELGEFSWYIAVARAMLRDYPELVQSKNFPKDLKAAYRNYCERGNPEDEGYYDPRRPEARKEARKFLKKHWGRHAS